MSGNEGLNYARQWKRQKNKMAVVELWAAWWPQVCGEMTEMVPGWLDYALKLMDTRVEDGGFSFIQIMFEMLLWMLKYVIPTPKDILIL